MIRIEKSVKQKQGIMEKISFSKEISNTIKALTPEDRDALLYRYMFAERVAMVSNPLCQLHEVRNNDRNGRGVGGWCDVVVTNSDGCRRVVNFSSRLAKLIYVFAMRHTEGFTRSSLKAGRNELFELWDELFNYDNLQLIDLLEATDFNHRLSVAVTATRSAIAKALEGIDKCSWYELDCKDSLLFIPLLKTAA